MTPKTKSLWPRLILLGDSLTQMSFSSEGGWGAMLADSLQRRCDVIPRGFSGYNTRQWQSLCKELPVESLCADVALLWLGANDACRSPQQNVPLPEYKNNLAFIVRFLNVSVLFHYPNFRGFLTHLMAVFFLITDMLLCLLFDMSVVIKKAAIK